MMEEKYNYYIVKGDVSGIQNFIFNVKNKGAAKTLKARSFFIDAIGLLAEEYLRNIFPQLERIYNGGGNFYVKINSVDWDINKFHLSTDFFLRTFQYLNISLNLSFIEYEDNYGLTIESLNQSVNNFKQTKYQETDYLFSPFEKIDSSAQDYFKKFSEGLTKYNYFELIKSDVQEFPELVGATSISLFGYKLQLTSDKTQNSVFHNLPIWSSQLLRNSNLEHEDSKPRQGSIIDFGYLAQFAKFRTGTNKIAALKLDIDNLGSLFKNTQDEDNNKYLSSQISTFFTQSFSDVLGQKYNYRTVKIDHSGKICKEKEHWYNGFKKVSFDSNILEDRTVSFKENLYVVFAGGDDCFIIGAWDAVIEFSIRLKKKFDSFESIMRQPLGLSNPLTFSAAIIIVDHHFPIVRMAEIVEDRLHLAKTHLANSTGLDATGNPIKNKISLLGKIFSWEEFEIVFGIKEHFIEMINKYNEHRAFLQRIQNVFEGKDQIDWLKRMKPYDPSVLWRFKYHFRDIKEKSYFQKNYYDKFFGENKLYDEEVLNKYHINNAKNQKFPVAARWAEFLTKKD